MLSILCCGSSYPCRISGRTLFRLPFHEREEEGGEGCGGVSREDWQLFGEDTPYILCGSPADREDLYSYHLWCCLLLYGYFTE